MRRKESVILLGMMTLVALCATGAYASGFAIVEQGVRGLGTAYAGAAALAEDPSTIFYNPAGMVRLSGKQTEFGLHYIVPQAKYKDKGSTITPLAGGAPLTGGDGGDAGEPAIVPNLYYTQQVSDGTVFGIGIYAPFGLSSKYDENWVGRYHAIESELSTININPSAAVRMNDKWSVGAGFNILYADATLSSKADLGLIRQVQTQEQSGAQQLDGFSEITGDGWAYGFNIGLLFEPNQGTRVGLSFRSSLHLKVEADVEWRYSSQTAEAVATQARLVDGKAHAVIDLPESLSLAGYHEFNDKLAILADITFTKWERFDELRIKFDNSPNDSVITTKWDDSWKFGLGLIYTPTDRCTGRFGITYDQTPIPSKEFRTPRIPGGDRFWVAFGAGYKLTSQWEINLGYTHILVDDPEVEKSAADPTSENFIRGSLVGEWDAVIDVYSINVNYAF